MLQLLARLANALTRHLMLKPVLSLVLLTTELHHFTLSAVLKVDLLAANDAARDELSDFLFFRCHRVLDIVVCAMLGDFRKDPE